MPWPQPRTRRSRMARRGTMRLASREPTMPPRGLIQLQSRGCCFSPVAAFPKAVHMLLHSHSAAFPKAVHKLLHCCIPHSPLARHDGPRGSDDIVGPMIEVGSEHSSEDEDEREAAITAVCEAALHTAPVIDMAEPPPTDAPSADEPPLPPPDKPPPIQPPVIDVEDGAVGEHFFLWLTRSTRAATCKTCKLPVPPHTFRCVFDPPMSRLGRNRNWQPILWKYFHIAHACLQPLRLEIEAMPGCRAAGGGAGSSSSSSASWLERRGWKIATDVAPLPRQMKETREQRQEATSAALAKLSENFEDSCIVSDMYTVQIHGQSRFSCSIEHRQLLLDCPRRHFSKQIGLWMRLFLIYEFVLC